MRVALFGNGASNTPSLSGSDVTVYLFGDDNLSGTRLDDVIRSGCGNDTINGGGWRQYGPKKES